MFVLVLSTFCVLTITQLKIRPCHWLENVDAVGKTVRGFVVAVIRFQSRIMRYRTGGRNEAENLDHVV